MDQERVSITPAAQALVEELIRRHGPLMFHQSGGCCDGSAPMCYPRGEFRVGARDVHLGDIAGCPFYMGADQFARWAHTHLTVDVVPGRGSGFSLEAPEGVRFIIRSRLMAADGSISEPTADSMADACPVEPGGDNGPAASVEVETPAATPSDRR
ncbi:MAG: DUF779 domain-containing protein [Rhodospirillales bacterium]|nr:MAG: DUF779 domain-containing protein [Rhodospirillales bacterium]